MTLSISLRSFKVDVTLYLVLKVTVKSVVLNLIS